MSERPLISVAMCTYNGEKYLQEQLDSIAAQTILPAELVVCDDGSTDSSLVILNRFAETASFPIHVHVNSENLGVARNFFKAIKRCTSQWVMLCDQDDVWLADKVETFLTAIQSNPKANLILSDAILVDHEKRPLPHTLLEAYRLARREKAWIDSGQAHRVLSRHVFVTGAAMVVRRPFMAAVPEPMGGFLHDEWAAWFASPFISLIQKPTFYYRQHQQQVTGIDGRFQAQLKRVTQPASKSIITIEEGIRRFELLQQQLHAYQNASPDARSAVTDKIRFLNTRRQLPHSVWARACSIVFKIGLTNYWKFSSGWRTLVKDLAGTGRL